jgi:hypothetical protein
MTVFTREEAEAMLAQVSGELLAMQRCKSAIDELRADLAGAVETSAGNGHVHDETSLGEKRRRAEGLVGELNDRLARVNGWGIEVKDIDSGLIDFPSEREGRAVYLCWRLGEARIAWWHELDTGFAGRQLLD